jgi:hypothetical protein
MMDKFIDNQGPDHASNIHDGMFDRKSSPASRVTVCLVSYVADFNVKWMKTYPNHHCMIVVVKEER